MSSNWDERHYGKSQREIRLSKQNSPKPASERGLFRAKVKRHGGWMEGDVARFPSVAAKEAFEADHA